MPAVGHGVGDVRAALQGARGPRSPPPNHLPLISEGDDGVGDVRAVLQGALGPR